jgi:hypothetical protein
MGIPQGDLKLLDAELATRLLHSKTPARLAYIAKDGTAAGHSYLVSLEWERICHGHIHCGTA